jgi:hypothetical protein
MAQYDQDAAADDYDDIGAGTDTIQTSCSGTDPEAATSCYGTINSSAIPDSDVISAATFYIYVHSITYTKQTRAFRVFVESFDCGTVAATTAGWKSLALPSGALSSISKTGNTNIRVTVDGGTYEESVLIYNFRAYEYDPDGTLDMYLEVTHAAAGGKTIDDVTVSKLDGVAVTKIDGV